MHRRLGLLLALLLLIPWSAASAAPRCFGETNHCLDGRIHQFWEQNGALPVFGFPIAPAGTELNRDTGQRYETQWLERNRFELHPEHAAPYDLLLGRLGDDRLRQVGIDWNTFAKADPGTAHFFPQTGHAIAHAPFWQYWSTHGLELGDRGVSARESLALFGLPLSEPQLETNPNGDRVLTQWFERARFEDHGAQGVLLGLLGREVRDNSQLRPARTPNTTRLVWFYRPPGDGTSAPILARTVHDYILTKSDERFRNALIAAGVPRERIFQYIMSNAIHDPRSCTRQPWSNQYAFNPGDFCRIAEQHPDWFLLDRNGNRICGNNQRERFCHMDPGNTGWQTFAVARLRELHDRWGWTGVFLDNVDASLERAGGATQQYADDAGFQAAVEAYLAFLQDNYFRAAGYPLLANITKQRDDETWYRYTQHLDGAMEEGCLVGWAEEYPSAKRWEAQLEKIQRTEALGKLFICVAQGRKEATLRQEFAFASYLLVTHGLTAFRYTEASRYHEFWSYPSYGLELGAPLGERYREGAGWRRDFERGAVFVDPQTHTATFTTSQP